MIPVLVDDSSIPSASPEVRGGPVLGASAEGPTLGPLNSLVKPLNLEALKSSAGDLASQVCELFSSLKEVAGFELAEISISVSVSAEGQLILIGKAGVEGGISLKFTPPQTLRSMVEPSGKPDAPND